MLNYRFATENDVLLYFKWANDSDVREQSFNSDEIDIESHKKWFTSKLHDRCCTLSIFVNENGDNVGQIRIEKKVDNQAIIGISVDEQYRGKGYAKEMLQISTNEFLKLNKEYVIHAYIKETNLNSKYAFEKAGFEFKQIIIYNNIDSFWYIKKVKNENR